MKIIYLLLLTTLSAHADITVPMNLVNDKGIVQSIGNIVISESAYGLVFTPRIEGLPAGAHGFHMHENASCAAKEQNGKMVPALAAGGHYDPHGSKRHGSPWGDGHLGDLPALIIGADGKTNQPVLAPRLKMADLKEHTLMIHMGGDNHADHPAALGGGGARVACGIIPN
ncbi:superoxide dismutase family protein [Iodobacter fluviatilis]|uniref:Superoxide dismutase [Cu-Zn] n=1 Tax=Iodobacter fluviatilis TaxID=537 RepID=A0A7G3GFH7_9NEIS|nr:superoxide dismutase family protein [Iodobacter fluviatilis]QBC45525.1 superoxide dismutase [Cu-Zn] SodC2 [Iodobacter fluviatilis]